MLVLRIGTYWRLWFRYVFVNAARYDGSELVLFQFRPVFSKRLIIQKIIEPVVALCSTRIRSLLLAVRTYVVLDMDLSAMVCVLGSKDSCRWEWNTHLMRKDIGSVVEFGV